MKASLVISALTLTIVMAGCSAGTAPETAVATTTENEKVIESFPGGNPKNVVKTLPNSDVVVEQTLFYENGEIHMHGSFDNGKRHGAWETFYQDGKPWSLNTYSMGILEGSYKAWFENGQIRIEGQYSAGKRSGTWKYFDESGMMTKSEDL